jgi:hypothetical protein
MIEQICWLLLAAGFSSLLFATAYAVFKVAKEDK